MRIIVCFLLLISVEAFSQNNSTSIRVGRDFLPGNYFCNYSPMLNLSAMYTHNLNSKVQIASEIKLASLYHKPTSNSAKKIEINVGVQFIILKIKSYSFQINFLSGYQYINLSSKDSDYPFIVKLNGLQLKSELIVSKSISSKIDIFISPSISKGVLVYNRNFFKNPSYYKTTFSDYCLGLSYKS